MDSIDTAPAAQAALELVSAEDLTQDSAAGGCFSTAGTLGCPSTISTQACLS